MLLYSHHVTQYVVTVPATFRGTAFQFLTRSTNLIYDLDFSFA